MGGAWARLAGITGLTAGMAFPEFAQTDRPMWRENPSNLLRPDRIPASAKAVQSAVCTINPNLL